MSKRIALYDYIEIDHIDLSTFFRTFGFSSEHAREDVSGFSASGADEFLAGRTTQSLSGEVFGARGSNESFQVLYTLHRDKSIFPIVWRTSRDAVSATNQELRGNAQLLTFSVTATRGDVEVWTAEFSAADSTGFVYYET